MTFEGLSARRSLLHSTDPRARIFACALFIAAATLASAPQTLCALLALSFALLALARTSPLEILPRILLLNLFVALLAATLPGREGFFALSGGFQDGAAARLLALWLRSNTMLLGATALAGSIETSAFGHALAHFGVPDKLSHLFLFTVSQTETLARESERLRDAMKARAFRPALSLHCHKSLATLAASLLARSLERAEKLSESMRCRNFKGRFYLFHHFKMRGSDWLFSAAALTLALGAAALEALCRNS